MDFWQITRLFLVRLALAAAVLWSVYRYIGMIPFILSIPVAGVLLAKPIIEAGENWLQWAKRQPYAEWQGNYYAFADHQVRVLEVGRELWVVDSDLLRVIGEKPSLMLASLYDRHDYDAIPETRLHGFSPSGAEKVLMKSDHYEAKRMLMWLRREVYKPHRRKQEIASGTP